MTEVVWSQSSEDTVEAGIKFAALLTKGSSTALTGDLGAGKTEFVKGICKYFMVDDVVTSPTFTIINRYFANRKEFEDLNIFHIDLYRIKDIKELVEIGFDECISDADSIKLIEWADRAGRSPEFYDFIVRITNDDNDENVRQIVIESN